MSEIPIEINSASGLIAIGVLLLLNGVLAMAETALAASRTYPAIHSINPARINHSNESVKFQIRRPNGEFAAGAGFWFPELLGANPHGFDFKGTDRDERTPGGKT
jgi:hypothetical protein